MTETENYLLEETAGHVSEGIPMTEEQAYYLHEYIDPQIDKIMAELDKEIERRKESDEYQRRTLHDL